MHHDLDLIRDTIAIKKDLCLGKGKINPCAINVVAPRREDIDHLIGAHAGRGAKGRLDPVGRNDLDPVADNGAKLLRYTHADGDPLTKARDVAAPCLRVRNTRKLGKVFRTDSKDFHAGVTVAQVGHHLPFDERRRPHHTGHPAQAFGHRLKVVDRAINPAIIGDFARAIDRHMGVGTKDRINKLRPKPRAHGKRRDQGKDRERDAEKADPCHDTHAAFGAPCAQVTPRDHPLERGKRRGGACHVCSGSLGGLFSVATLRPVPDPVKKAPFFTFVEILPPEANPAGSGP